MINKKEIRRLSEYDFSNLVYAMDDIIISKGSSTKLEQLEKVLNKTFPNKKCIEVMYTVNTDRMFFGMNLLPIINKGELTKNLNEDDPDPIGLYAIELDSKLLNPILNFTGEHLTAIILHEIGHMILDEDVIAEFMDALHVKLQKDRDILNKDMFIKSEPLFKFAAIDTMRKMHSFFYKNKNEIYADKFVEICGFGGFLRDAFDAIVRKSFKINCDVKNKLLVLQWTLRNYKELEVNRKEIAKVLYNFGNLTASKLDKQLASTVTKSLDEISIYAIGNELLEEGRKLSFFDKMRKDSIRTLENDLYELKIRSKTASDEGDTMFVLRSLNNRLSIMEEILTDSQIELSDSDRDRWIACQQNYLAVREELASKKISKIKMYGLFTDYTQSPNGNIYNASSRY